MRKERSPKKAWGRIVRESISYSVDIAKVGKLPRIIRGTRWFQAERRFRKKIKTYYLKNFKLNINEKLH